MIRCRAPPAGMVPAYLTPAIFHVIVSVMKSPTTAVETRVYHMGARAESTAATGDRILDAAVEVFWERPTDQVSLDEVARRAGVSVRTVLRRFGDKDGLFAAAVARESAEVRQFRDEAPVGDLSAAVAVLVAHYELVGDRVLKMLTNEHQVAGLDEIIAAGKDLHRQWCARVFEPSLAGLSATQRRRRLAQFVAVCDVYTWNLLRRDAGLSRRQTELALVELLTPMMEES